LISRPDSESYDGIPAASPLVRRQHANEQFPPDISIPPANIVQTDKLAKAYYQQIATTINRNEEAITSTVKQQLEDYIKLAGVLETRRNELDGRLAKMLSLFRAFDSEVKTSVELLNSEIERAERIAAEIDGEIPKYSEFDGK
jgi:hypothetical protein